MSADLRTALRSSDPNPELVTRLKAAVKKGGGNKAVADRAGLKIGTLNNYLRSVHRVPADAAIRIAGACKVSIDWLLRGEGPMDYLPVGHEGEAAVVVAGPAMPFQTPAEDRLAKTVALDRMTVAMALTEEAFTFHKHIADPNRKAELLVLIYDFLKTQTPDDIRVMLDIKRLVPDRSRQD